jgi:hypothetical protein
MLTTFEKGASMSASTLNQAGLRLRKRRSLILGMFLAVLVISFYVYSIFVMGSAAIMRDL